ncbi:hypothetical protein VPH35_015513 [Triticum aestivum]
MQKTFQTGVPAMEHWISAILLVLHTRILSNGVEIVAALSLVTFAKDWLKEQSHNTGKCCSPVFDCILVPSLQAISLHYSPFHVVVTRDFTVSPCYHVLS